MQTLVADSVKMNERLVSGINLVDEATRKIKAKRVGKTDPATVL